MNASVYFWELNSTFYDFFMKTNFYSRLYEEILESLGNLENIKIDDMGCGTGELIRRMPETAIIRGIDSSLLAIKKAKKKSHNHNVTFFNSDLYSELPDEYKPDKVVASRSLYNKNLSLSLGILSNHLKNDGLAVVVHPVEDFLKFIKPNKLVQLVRSSPRILSKFLPYDYNLFSSDDFEKYGNIHFNSVEISEVGEGTHYLVKLQK